MKFAMIRNNEELGWFEPATIINEGKTLLTAGIKVIDPIDGQVTEKIVTEPVDSGMVEAYGDKFIYHRLFGDVRHAVNNIGIGLYFDIGYAKFDVEKLFEEFKRAGILLVEKRK